MGWYDAVLGAAEDTPSCVIPGTAIPDIDCIRRLPVPPLPPGPPRLPSLTSGAGWVVAAFALWWLAKGRR